MELVCKETCVEMTIQHFEFASLIGRTGWINPFTFLNIKGIAGTPVENLIDEVVRKGGHGERIIYFTKWQQTEFFPSLYKEIVDRSGISGLELLNRKVQVYQQFLPPRNTSQLNECYFVDYDTRKPLVLATSLDVNVDPITRRPMPFPSSVKEYFTPEKCIPTVKFNEVAPPSCQQLYDIPCDVITFTMTSEVTLQQIDHNNHVNQAEYFNFCMDCVGAAFVKSIFGPFGSIFNYRLKRISILHVDQVVLGESVETVCWHSDKNPFVFKFHVRNHKGLVCQAEFEFFPHENLHSKKSLL